MSSRASSGTRCARTRPASRSPCCSGSPTSRYGNIDEIAEQLAQVQPAYEHEVPHSPREESGAPPGGDAYTELRPESGQVRDLDAVTGG